MPYAKGEPTGKTIAHLSSSAARKGLTPGDIMKLRGKTLQIVNNRLADAGKVLDGKKQWNNQQVRLFGILLNKIMPDLHHSVVQGELEVHTKDAHELTREELEAIVAKGEAAAEEDDGISDAEYEDVTDEVMNADLDFMDKNGT